MLEINLNNVEDVILVDSRLRSLLPDLQKYFDTWFMARLGSGLKSLATRTKLELLQAIRPEHLAVISKYLGKELTLRPFDSNVVTNRECRVSETIECLEGLAEYAEIAVFRRGDTVHITAWR